MASVHALERVFAHNGKVEMVNLHDSSTKTRCFEEVLEKFLESILIQTSHLIPMEMKPKKPIKTKNRKVITFKGFYPSIKELLQFIK